MQTNRRSTDLSDDALDALIMSASSDEQKATLLFVQKVSVVLQDIAGSLHELNEKTNRNETRIANSIDQLMLQFRDHEKKDDARIVDDKVQYAKSRTVFKIYSAIATALLAGAVAISGALFYEYQTLRDASRDALKRLDILDLQIAKIITQHDEILMKSQVKIEMLQNQIEDVNNKKVIKASK
jgi:hypothetical protein